MSTVKVTIGLAVVSLDAASTRVRADGGETIVHSVDFQFDDVLHAVNRLAGAVLNEADTQRVNAALTRLRQQLSDPERSMIPAWQA